MEEVNGVSYALWKHGWEFSNWWHWLAAITEQIAKDKGWYDKPTPMAQELLLVHSELSQACEALRVGNPQSEKIPRFTCLEEELADAVIRIMNIAAQNDLNLSSAILAKVEYNSTRPRMHGGKLF